MLFLEGAEDFDVHRTDGVTATQVKDTVGSGTVTLRSGDAVDAINHLWLHKKNNPDTEVRLRFLTTASPGPGARRHIWWYPWDRILVIGKEGPRMPG